MIFLEKAFKKHTMVMKKTWNYALVPRHPLNTCVYLTKKYIVGAGFKYLVPVAGATKSLGEGRGEVEPR